MGTNAMGTNAPTSTGRPRRPCTQNPAGWDLDSGELEDWLSAIRACMACPVLRLCWERRNRLYSDEHPAGVIWAGTAYTGTGVPLTTGSALVAYAVRVARERAPKVVAGADLNVSRAA